MASPADEHVLEVRTETHEVDIGIPFFVTVPGARSYYLDGEQISEDEAARFLNRQTE